MTMPKKRKRKNAKEKMQKVKSRKRKHQCKDEGKQKCTHKKENTTE